MKENREKIRIFLVRHGQTEWNRQRRFQGLSDIPLNTEGNQQAEALALRLCNEGLSALYSSHLIRAKQTAEHIGRYHPRTPIVVVNDLAEMDLGDFEGMSVDTWQKRYPQFREQWLARPAALPMPGGESLMDVQLRSIQTLQRICRGHNPGDTLVICTHNFVIVSLLCFVANVSLDNFREMRQDTAALNSIYYDGSDFDLGVVNDLEHLG